MLKLSVSSISSRIAVCSADMVDASMILATVNKAAALVQTAKLLSFPELLRRNMPHAWHDACLLCSREFDSVTMTELLYPSSLQATADVHQQ